MKKRVWIAWETQRRSIELSKQLGCEIFIIEYNRLMRYPLCILRTLLILWKTKPNELFVPNPSMILATVACIYRLISKTPVVVDRHTTFRLKKPHSGSFRVWVFMRLHYFTIRTADLTIVTNDFLASLVKQIGGNPFVLPDKLPHLVSNKKIALKGKRNILLISSFGKDEPIIAAIQAMWNFNQEDVCLYITSNYKKLDVKLPEISPKNTIFTGFLAEQEFVDILFSVDAVMVLTTSDYCMLCGCYEAVAASKPLITSDKKVLRDYFEGAVFVDNTEDGISVGIKELLNRLEAYTLNIKRLKETLSSYWNSLYHNLEKHILSRSGIH